MLVVAGVVRLNPEKREEAMVAAREMMTATRAEAGCISYTFSADLDDPGAFRIFEEWKDQAALDAHFEAPHMATFAAKVGGFGVEEMTVQKYEVASVGPVR
ncbi:MAG: putative quinol monooxygenase [Myxococcota bacterium]